MSRSMLVFILAVATFPAHAANVSCTENSNTRQLTCFNPAAVRSNGDLRATVLYMGGARQIDKTAYTMVVNCRVGYIELRDRKGVVFARDQPDKLHSINLRDNICGAKATHDKTLD